MNTITTILSILWPLTLLTLWIIGTWLVFRKGKKDGKLYKFLGKPDSRFPKLKTGKVYRLVVEERHWSFWEWIMGIKHPQIITPFLCPYQSWKTFNQNWKLHEEQKGKKV